jgi:hypothetical protein
VKCYGTWNKKINVVEFINDIFFRWNSKLGFGYWKFEVKFFNESLK